MEERSELWVEVEGQGILLRVKENCVRDSHGKESDVSDTVSSHENIGVFLALE
jgi:hypothetical protein